MKHKQIELYLFDSDIEELNKRYSTLYSNVKNDKDLSDEQRIRECEILRQKYDFEIEQLSALREPDYWKQQAQIKAKKKEQTPWRRCWLWRLFLLPLTNRAQDIIEREAELDAEAAFAPKEKELEERADKLYANTGNILSRRQRKKVLKKYLKYKRLLEADSADVADDDAQDSTADKFEEVLHAADAAEPAEVFTQPELPEEKPADDDAQDNTDDKLEEALHAADAAEPAEVFTQPEPPEVKLADVQNADKQQEPAPMENAAAPSEPPAPPIRKPRSTKK